MLKAKVRRELKSGDRISCTSNSGEIKNGAIADILDTQYFIEFDDGCTTFIFHQDASLNLEE